MGNVRGIAVWRWLYIIEGSVICFIGLAICFLLPDFPDTWRSLTEEQQAVSLRRLAIEAAEADIDEVGGMFHSTKSNPSNIIDMDKV